MQTERVTFLTSRDHKAALDAFAAARGKSVGNVVREATVQYIAQPPEQAGDQDAMFKLLLEELEEAIPKWNAKFDSMEANLDRAHIAVREALKRVDGDTG